MLNMVMILEDMTESVFKKTEEYLHKFPKVKKKILHIARRKKIHRYRCFMDFLSMEIFTALKESCWQFYNGKGPSLKNLYSKVVLDWMDSALLCAVKLAENTDPDN